MEKKGGIKQAWIDEGNRVISFERIRDARLFRAVEEDFWEQIKSLIQKGYMLR